MLKVYVMDETGHSTLEFSERERADGCALLEKLLAEGGKVLATRKAGESDYRVVRDPARVEDEALLIPQRQGG